MDAYFARMQEIMQGNLPSRIRFMIQDAIDLRTNNWRPRFEVAGPKTMQDIRMDALREQAARKGIVLRKMTAEPGLLPDPPDLVRLTMGDMPVSSPPGSSPRLTPKMARAKGGDGPRRDVVSPDVVCTCNSYISKDIYVYFYVYIYISVCV